MVRLLLCLPGSVDTAFHRCRILSARALLDTHDMIVRFTVHLGFGHGRAEYRAHLHNHLHRLSYRLAGDCDTMTASSEYSIVPPYLPGWS